MTQQEFESRTGLNVSASDFDYINRVYMAAGPLDKDTFCDEWKDRHKNIRTSEIVCSLVMENENQAETIRLQGTQLQREQENFHAFSSHMVDFLILQAHKWSATDLREKAIKLVGKREYLRRVIDMKLDFWKADLEALVEILKDE